VRHSGRQSIDPSIIDTATLLVSELATNAVVHATSTIGFESMSARTFA